MRNLVVSAGAVMALALPVSANHGWDGVIGTEWAGITPFQVTYDPAAPLGNFGSPGTTNHVTGYEIFTRSDNDYIYVALRTTGPNDTSGVFFSNLGFALRYGSGATGSAETTVTIEVLNDRAGKNGLFYSDTAADLIRFGTTNGDGTVSNPDVIETGIHWSLFLNNALGITGFDLPAGETAAGVRLFRSQNFGYSVVGGTAYGPNMLGFFSTPSATAAAPEPTTGLLLLTALPLGPVLARKRKK